MKTHSHRKDHMIRPGNDPEGHQFNPASAAAMSGHGVLFSGHGIGASGILKPSNTHLIGRTHEAASDDKARADQARAKRTRNVLSALAASQAQPRGSSPEAEADDDGFHHSASQMHHMPKEGHQGSRGAPAAAKWKTFNDSIGTNHGLGTAKSRPEEPASHYIKKGHGFSKASVQVGSMKLQRRDAGGHESSESESVGAQRGLSDERRRSSGQKSSGTSQRKSSRKG
jgi:hypothetical protein